jgi:hypothetical protein
LHFFLRRLTPGLLYIYIRLLSTMVAIEVVRASNAQLHELGPGLVALIGEFRRPEPFSLHL